VKVQKQEIEREKERELFEEEKNKLQEERKLFEEEKKKLILPQFDRFGIPITRRTMLKF